MLRLCSASETRAGILRKAGINFVVSPVDFDEESVQAEDPRSFVYAVSRGKMELARSIFGLDMQLLTADTVIAGPTGEILRKAPNAAEAERLLRIQSGSEIKIFTCVHLLTAEYTFIDLSSTSYLFDSFNKDDMGRYLDSGEWRGKAGACMVEGFCESYIVQMRGLKSTAMGLQIEKIRPWLGER